jgi:hypothetical protein
VLSLSLSLSPSLQFFGELHKLYVNAMSNPFAPIGERITSPTFDKKVDALVTQQNSSA